MTKSAQVGGLDINKYPYTVLGAEYAPQLPDARLSEFGRAAQLSGASPDESHYDDAPFEISVGVDDPTRAYINALYAAFAPGAEIVWEEDTGSSTTTIVTVDAADTVIHDGYTICTFAGTRTPAWDTTSSDFSLTIADGFGYAIIPAVTGELAAKMSLSARCSSASALIAAGVKPVASVNLVPDFAGDDDSNGVADGWYATAGATATYNVNDNWQRLAKTSSAGSEYVAIYSGHVTAATGERIVAQCRMFGQTTDAQMRLQIVQYDSGDSVVDYGTKNVTLSWTKTTFAHEVTCDTDTAYVVFEMSASLPNASSAVNVYINDPIVIRTTYDPIDDYSGAADVNAYGDAKSIAAGLTQNTATAVATAPNVSVAENRGNHLAVARVESNATVSAIKYRVGSDTGVAPIYEPYVAATAASETTALGMVQIPAYDLPPNTAEGAWVAATGISQTTAASAVSSPLNGTGRTVYQTFTLASKRKVTGATCKVTASSSATVTFSIYSTSGGVPAYGGSLASQSVTAPTGYTVLSATFDEVLEPGVYALVMSEGGRRPTGAVTFWRDTGASYSDGVGGHLSTAGVWTAGDGTDTTIDWYFTLTLQSELTFNATTPVQALCTESGKTAAIDVLTRIPTDNGWMLATGTFGANEGVYLDAGLNQVFPYSSAGVTGAALSTVTMPSPPRPVPEKVNLLVMACSGVNTLTLTGTVTARRIHRG